MRATAGYALLGVVLTQSLGGLALGQPAALVAPPRFVYDEGAGGADEDDVRTSWTWQLEPAVHFASPGGDIRLPGGSGRGPKIALADINLDSPRLSPGFDVSLRRGRWRLNAQGLFFDADGRGARSPGASALGATPVAPGDRTRFDLRYTQVDLRGAYTLRDAALSPRSHGPGHRLRLRLDVEGGLRFYDVAFEGVNLDAAGGAAGVDVREWFVEPHGGFKASVDFLERFTMDLHTSIGGFPAIQSVYSWDIGVGFQWRPTPYLGVQMGYRSTIFSLDSGDGADAFEWQGAVQGLMGGLAVRF